MTLRLASLLLVLLPISHQPRRPVKPPPADRPFFVADTQALIPQRQLDFNQHETATPVLDAATTRMYVGLSDGLLRCRFHGKTTWTYNAGGAILAAPLIDGETIYVASGGGRLAALNRITGEERWPPFEAHEELTTTPTLSEGKLFVMSSDEALTAVDAATGKSLWKFRREKPAGFTIRGNARPVVAHGAVYAAYADGNVVALRPQDGVARWIRNVSGAGDYLDVDSLAAPADDKRIYAASAKAGIAALDADTGEPAWAFELPGANQLLVEGARVFASGRAAVVALDRGSGKKLWSFALGKEQYATAAAFSRGALIFAEDRGPLIALDVSSGRPRAVLDPGPGFSEAPLVIPGAAFIVSNGAQLYSLGLFP